MAAQRRPLTGLLKQPIHLGDAPARGLRVAFAVPPDASDLLAYLEKELSARFAELDKFFGLNSESADIWEQRAKALVEREFWIRSNDSQWWGRFALYIITRNVPGFSLKRADEKRRGAPRQWTFERLAQLFADIELQKKKTGKSVRDICKNLPRRKEYIGRWGRYRGTDDALRKAYTTAKKLRQHVIFELELCGPEAMMPAKRIDRIEAAIERHALKI